MTILVIGGRGMLGSDVCAEATRRGHVVHAPTSSELSITDPLSLSKIATRYWEDVDCCINCSAYTAVDKAESDQAAAFSLNALGPGYLAGACAISGIRLIHVSTDYVFDGKSCSRYKEGDKTNPLSIYGRSKLEGETAVQAQNPDSVVVRTSWLFGRCGNSFPRSILRAWLRGDRLRIVGDQIGCPTYTADLARAIIDLAQVKVGGGIYHVCGPEALSWYQFGLLTVKAFAERFYPDREVQIEEIPSIEWPTPAPRPHFSALDCSKYLSVGLSPLRPPAEALADLFDCVGADWV